MGRPRRGRPVCRTLLLQSNGDRLKELRGDGDRAALATQTDDANPPRVGAHDEIPFTYARDRQGILRRAFVGGDEDQHPTHRTTPVTRIVKALAPERPITSAKVIEHLEPARAFHHKERLLQGLDLIGRQHGSFGPGAALRGFVREHGGGSEEHDLDGASDAMVDPIDQAVGHGGHGCGQEATGEDRAPQGLGRRQSSQQGPTGEARGMDGDGGAEVPAGEGIVVDVTRPLDVIELGDGPKHPQ